MKRIRQFLKSNEKTRNKILLFAIVFVLVYTILDIVYGFVALMFSIPAQLDPTLTTNVFDFSKWLVTTGAAITVTKTLKGRTNSDEDEKEEVFDDITSEVDSM